AARAAHRIILTCDRGLLCHKAVTHGYYVRSRQPLEQAREVVRRFDLAGAVRPFSRCMACNGLLESASPAAVAAGAPPRARRLYREFRRCRACGRIYWRGSHYARLARRVTAVTGDA
ncbi:MAG: twitching motility protein PilT, partial [Lentisphaerae bacterium]|nr:twitching motility protein PilT [Lentisphaerota bacterium]